MGRNPSGSTGCVGTNFRNLRDNGKGKLVENWENKNKRKIGENRGSKMAEIEGENGEKSERNERKLEVFFTLTRQGGQKRQKITKNRGKKW